ncbi:MAG: hexokinase [Verrucomicrobia bacterium]|jgi:hexokinase|nr:hexokinase [Verrucomicrobiota bacterium]
MNTFNATQWLREQHVAADLYDPEELISNFMAEMESGLGGRPSSLAMIPAYVGTEQSVPRNKPVAVIDAGGTNLRVCLASFDLEGNIELSMFSKQPMLGTQGALSANAFYAALADAIEPMMTISDSIGFCFSFPAEITPQFDGRLLHWTKEIQAPEVVGQCVGQALLSTLAERGYSNKQVVVLNDTVAALLAGMAKGQTFNASSYIGFILGTGTNTAYVEHNGNIAKIPDLDPAGSQVINVESGGFSKLSRGPLDLKLDEESSNPGQHVFEKIISGVYMGPLTLELFKAACPHAAFSARGSAAIESMNELSTIHIDNLLADNGRDTGILGTETFSGEDRQFMRRVFGAVVDRAALLTAVNIGAAVIKSEKGAAQERPVCVNIDGSTYYKTTGMPEKVQAHLAGIMDKHGRHIRCIHVDDAPVVGAAIAGLTTFG